MSPPHDRPGRQSHARPAEPFPHAEDFEEPVEVPKVTLGSLQQMMIDGFAEINERIDELPTKKDVSALAIRVDKIELDARWKQRVIFVGKAAAPALLGYLAHYVPELAKHLPAILEAIAKYGAP